MVQNHSKTMGPVPVVCMISAQVAGIALGFSVLVGVVFGIYPANKAAGLKPINALRYE